MSATEPSAPGAGTSPPSIRSTVPTGEAPPQGEVLVSLDGSFWVERVDQRSPAADYILRSYVPFSRETPWPPRFASRYDLFDADGRFLGSVDLPAGFRAMAIDGLEVTGSWRDDLDVQSLTRFRVVPPV